MDDIRLAARNYLRTVNSEDVCLFQVNDSDIGPLNLHALWTNISSLRAQDAQESAVKEELLVLRHVLKLGRSEASLGEQDITSANEIYAWLAQISLPSFQFASALEALYSANEKESELSATLKARQSTFELSISCIKYLHDLLPVIESVNSLEVLTTLSSFTSLRDPWTTTASLNDALAVLQSCMQPERRSTCWPILQRICQSRIRPIFAKTKNPAITATGRKNLHPLPRPRFDDSLFDPESKPWKHRDVYATTVLEWILTQYNSSDISGLESDFHLYIPPILSLIDDESASFKYRGCILLTKFLTPIRMSDSDLLRRTNLSSVFDDALTPCLLSLPSITPEEESLQLLGAAYPVLLLTLQARYHVKSDPKPDQPVTRKNHDDSETYRTRLITLLRDSVISSFHHVSSYTPVSTTEGSSLASFPYPRLSTFLLDQLRTLVREIGIHTAKYLQEIVPIIYSTLVNPFGTACLPLLLAGVAAAQAVILNAYPRIWRYRGDFLAAICQCWINVSQDASDTNDPEKREQLRRVMSTLQGTVYLLKLGVQGAVAMKEEGEDHMNEAGIVDDKVINIENDVNALVEADGQLKDVLEIDVDSGLDNRHFFD